MTASDARVVQLLKEARGALEAERKRRSEPIAIIGIGCRFPGGASNPAQFWDLLMNGVDATSEVPPDRWDASAVYDPDPNAPGKCYTKRGAFLDQISDFEPEVFGISPREALAMDPQQRLLLEVTWEALEDAGIPAETLRGSATGVWVGLSLDDYARRIIPTGELERIDPYTTLGNARSVAAGRIAYVFGLQGPVLQIDTACSSSLVALHLACESLRSTETRLALVGGVSLMSAPEASVALSKLMALSPDGRCKTFDAAADGYGRGEGCGIVVLKRLSDARADGDRIYAVIRGSAVNHDGRSNGLTAPNGLAQEALIRSALAHSGVEADQVAYVEAHGTGTLLGDPIEVMALNRVYGAARDPNRSLRIGSVKTNLGHLEAAAGIAALIKVALSVFNGSLVPSLHFRDPNPKIPWATLALRVATECAPWPEEFARRLSGVSSFGISGTNAHVLVEQPPEPEALGVDGERAAELVLMSAKTEAALLVVAERLLAHVKSHPTQTLHDIAHNLATTRSLLDSRMALAVSTREELCSALEDIERGTFESAKVSRRTGAEPRAKSAWIFSGQGAQVLGMGRGLAEQWPVFRGALDQACAVLDRHLERPLRAILWSTPESADAALLDQTAYTQPALFAFGWALAALWRSWGVEPDFVMGHSVGELTAACVAGLFSLEDAGRLVVERGRLMQALPAGGAMMAIATTEHALNDVLSGLSQRENLSLAAVNSPTSLVISGDEASVLLAAERFRALGVATQRLNVSHAFHSSLVEPMLADFRRVTENLTFREPSLPLVSNLNGRIAGPEVQTPAYWVRHAREAVRFADGARALEAAGARIFLELGPRATLLPMLAESLAQPALALLASGRKGLPETKAALSALAGWVGCDGPVNLKGVFPGQRPRASLPLYPFQRRRFWLDTPTNAERASGRSAQHPLLGRRLRCAGADATYEALLSAQSLAWLSAHRIGGRIVMPGAGLIEMLRAAAQHHHRIPDCSLAQLVLQQPLLIADDVARRVQVILSDAGTRASVYSQALEAEDSDWTLHATAQVDTQPGRAPQRLDFLDLARRCPEELDPAQVYGLFSKLGLEYGAAFRGLKRLARGGADVIAELELGGNENAGEYGAHPALLDAALQASAALAGAVEPTLMLPFEFARCVLLRPLGASARVHVRLLEPATPDSLRVDVTVSNQEGDVLVQLEGLSLRRAALVRPKSAAVLGADEAQFRFAWRELPPSASAKLEGTWAVLALEDAAPAAEALRSLSRLGVQARAVVLADLPRIEADHVVCAWNAVDDAEGAVRLAQLGLAVVQALGVRRAPPRLWWVTREAVAVAPGDAVSLAPSTLWGLGRTVMQEHPELNCTLLDLAHGDSISDALASVIGVGSAETQIAVRGPRRFVGRLERSSKATSGSGPALVPGVAGTQPQLDAPSTVLITGGLGALGLDFARWLADQGVQHLLLLSRRGSATPGAAQAIADLERRGARVTVEAVDAANRVALADALRRVPAELPLRGVIHAAGLLDDGLLLQQTPERFARVLAPKVQAAFNLHTLTRDMPLEWFVLCSSIAGALGSAGQGAYAAGNTFLDALASHRHALGLVGLSIAWGPWAEQGLAADLDYKLRARWTRQGLSPMESSQALAHFSELLACRDPQRIVAAIDLRKMGAALGASPAALWQALLARGARTRSDASAAWVADLARLSIEQRASAVAAAVQAEVARVLSLANPDAVPLDQPLNELGLDSLMAIELRDALAKRVAAALPATLVFEQPSAGAIASYLLAGPLRAEDAAPLVSHSSSTTQTAAPRQSAFIADAVLDPSFRPASQDLPSANAEAVLLTGATGFLGAFLLSELLQQSRAHVSCIVRAADSRAAYSRIVDNLRRYGLWEEAYASRLTALAGDLAQPYLGLGELQFGKIAEQVEAIYNNGAQLSFAAAYADLKDSHVNGTREILRLAASGRVKAVHHVSSTVVYDSSAYCQRLISESDRPSATEGMHLGYSQCKWVTENLMWQAASRGLPVTVHRPAFIGGSSVSGAWNTADFVCRLLKSIVETGFIPSDLDLDLNLSPVDYVARSIVELSRREASRGHAFHLHHPQSLPLVAVGEVLRGLGQSVTGIPYWDWIERLKTQTEGPLYPLVPILSLRWPPSQLTYFELSQRAYQPRLTCAETERALATAGITCPPLDAKLFGRYLGYLRGIGYLNQAP